MRLSRGASSDTKESPSQRSFSKRQYRFDTSSILTTVQSLQNSPRLLLPEDIFLILVSFVQILDSFEWILLVRHCDISCCWEFIEQISYAVQVTKKWIIKSKWRNNAKKTCVSSCLALYQLKLKNTLLKSLSTKIFIYENIGLWV